jgi:molybdopterin-binding protein
VQELIRIGEVAKALGVSIDTLRRWEADGRVEFVRRGRQRYLPAEELSELVRRHVGTGPHQTSARNRMPGTVVAVEKDGVMAKVELSCGPFRIVSLMSREAAEELGLEPGASATAVVKATTVIVER